MTAINNHTLFPEIVGQVQVKDEIAMRLDAFNAGQPMPSIIAVAPRGKGKTAVLRATGLKMRELTSGTKRYFELNGASWKNMKQFWTSVMNQIRDRDITVLVDESHKVGNDVQNALLTILAPEVNPVRTYTHDDMPVDFDLRRQTFFFATTDVQKMLPALINRFRRIDLEDYSNDEMTTILKKFCKGITFEKGVAEDVASTCRSTPRQALQLSEDIRSVLAPTKTLKFTQALWDKLRKRMGILPLGLNRLEYAVLEVLGKDVDLSLTKVAASLQMTPNSVRSDLELFLLRCGLMQIDTQGRNLTSAGREYLKEVADFRANAK